MISDTKHTHDKKNFSRGTNNTQKAAWKPETRIKKSIKFCDFSGCVICCCCRRRFRSLALFEFLCDFDCFACCYVAFLYVGRKIPYFAGLKYFSVSSVEIITRRFGIISVVVPSIANISDRINFDKSHSLISNY